MNLAGKKVFILVETIYNDLEFWYPYYRLKEAGAEVIVVGPMGGMVYNGKAGLPVKADAGMADVTAADCDGLIIPGGYAPDHMRRHPQMVQLVRDCVESRKWWLTATSLPAGHLMTCRLSCEPSYRHWHK
jgi:protease I